MARKELTDRSGSLRRVQTGKAQKARQFPLLNAEHDIAASVRAAYPRVSLGDLLGSARSAVAEALESGRGDSASSSMLILFVSFSEATGRAAVVNFCGGDLDAVWRRIEAWQNRLPAAARNARWLRIEWVTRRRALSWQQCQQIIRASKRNCFRYGISLDPDFKHAFLEQELNANAMLSMGEDHANAGLNGQNFADYGGRKYGRGFQLPQHPAQPVSLFTTQGMFFQHGHRPVSLHGYSGGIEGRDTGRRKIENLDDNIVCDLVRQASRFLGAQVDENGKFIYGLHPCFDLEINGYNTLSHAGTVHSMLEAWEVTKTPALKAAIERALHLLTQKLLRHYNLKNGDKVSYLIDLNREIKLGGTAMCMLALVKFTELTGDQRYLPLLERLALGIMHMQHPQTGQLTHVLNAGDLTIKERFRSICYDGQAAFGLMRLYGLTKDPRWLRGVEKAFDYFIAQEHWKAGDHWLGHCVNELTLYRPEERYFQFGIQNVAGHLDFVIERITTFPTLLGLMMAGHRMIGRLQKSEQHRHLLKQLDLEKFYRALNTRARHMLNGFFWPETAMFFKNPERVRGSFFIRHHSFRVRIDDVGHYLSAYLAYLRYYLRQPEAERAIGIADLNVKTTPLAPPLPADAVLAWGGDVNLGRRQHYRARQLGFENVLDIPELRSADLSIVNLECVVSTLGEQGTVKGEGGPYYYRARPEMLEILRSAGINAVAVANNHSGDYGAEALLQQQEILERVGIASAGSGKTVEEAFRPVYCRAGDLCVALFSVDATQHRFAAAQDAAGAAYLPLKNAGMWKAVFAPLVSAAKRKADLVLVAVHWGANHAIRPSAEEIEAGHALIDAGCDAVLGASAHRLQGVEIYKNKPIIHDAGDLLFDAIRSRPADGGVFRLGLGKEGVRWLEYLPVGVGFGFSRRVYGEQASALIGRFQEHCRHVGTALQTDRDRAYIELLPAKQVVHKLPQTTARMPVYNFGNLEEYLVPPDVGATQTVPEDARIAPVTLNGLTLLGVRVRPKDITRRRMLWVETWWRSDHPVTEDLRLGYLAVPRGKGQLTEWGRGMDHDPCDWMLPTRRWTPGTIYKDFYGIRPPQSRHLRNAPLQLEIRVIGNAPNTEVYVHPALFPVRIPDVKQRFSRDYRASFPDLSAHCQPGETWTAEQLQSVTGGRWLVKPPEGWFVRSVVNGPRHIGMRDAPTLFVAHTNHERAFHEGSTQPVKGLGDRHPLIAKNLDRLAGAIVSKAVPGLPDDFPLLQVEDPIKAQMELGLAARQRYKGPVIAVTGTVGKSSTIGLLETLFETGSYIKSVDNYNSRVGVPVQLANLAPHHQAAILEVAQSALWMQRGSITRLVRPTIAVITEIGLSQTNRLVKTTADVARWKSRVFDGLAPGGIAVLGEHLAHFETLHGAAIRHAAKVLTFGTGPEADLRILSRTADGTSTQVTIQCQGQIHDLSLPFAGKGMLNNAFGALAIAHALGRDLGDTALRLKDYTPEEGRLVRYAGTVAGKRIQILDDSWNAEVLSMLNAFAELRQQPVKGRKIAVLGRIVHLGDQAPALHASLAAPLIEAGVDLVLTHGEEMQHLRRQLPAGRLGGHFETASELFSSLSECVKEHDFVLLKGSRRDSDFGEMSHWLWQTKDG